MRVTISAILFACLALVVSAFNAAPATGHVSARPAVTTIQRVGMNANDFFDVGLDNPEVRAHARRAPNLRAADRPCHDRTAAASRLRFPWTTRCSLLVSARRVLDEPGTPAAPSAESKALGAHSGLAAGAMTRPSTPAISSSAWSTTSPEPSRSTLWHVHACKVRDLRSLSERAGALPVYSRCVSACLRRVCAHE